MSHGNDPDDTDHETSTAPKTKSIIQRWHESNKAFLVAALLVIIAAIRWLLVSIKRGTSAMEQGL